MFNTSIHLRIDRTLDANTAVWYPGRKYLDAYTMLDHLAEKEEPAVWYPGQKYLDANKNPT